MVNYEHPKFILGLKHRNEVESFSELEVTKGRIPLVVKSCRSD